MDIRIFQKARSIIADEVIGCKFDFEDKEGAADRAEEIILALENGGISLTSLGSAPPVTTIKLVDGTGGVVDTKTIR
jgi:hypothetical protein